MADEASAITSSIACKEVREGKKVIKETGCTVVPNVK
jgi:hypothetical protein